MWTNMVPRDDRPLSPIPTTVHLPHLERLSIACITVARCVLAAIVTPALTHLELRHLNTEALLDSSFDEDGDSDDEWQHFSQSPFSDQATGMSIRSLLASSPPIRYLDMNYADMRTKDFIYCFERLPELEHFSIVGSDMSDTVINLLMPVYTLEGGIRVRLPKLTTLELSICAQLSGEAIVRSISARTRFTDASPHHASFIEVRIANCVGYNVSHAQELHQILGSRLR
jgi:hypothetical protein